MKHQPPPLLLAAIALLGITAMFLIEPIPQDTAYHGFADTRTFLGITNFWNVLSNLPFILAGFAGITMLLRSSPPGILADIRIAYLLFFTGVLLTGFGSAYYHLQPDNSTLVWDRLPMSLSFMVFLSIVIAENVSIVSGRKLLLPLVIAGVGSVVYWHLTETRGHGDLRAYALIQFLPILLIPMMLLMFESRFEPGYHIWLVILMYLLSKLLEHFDAAVYSSLHVISGHSLKHIAAAAGAFIFYLALKNRRRRPGPRTHGAWAGG